MATINVIIKFKELKIMTADSIEGVCRLINFRNPDVTINEAYEEK